MRVTESRRRTRINRERRTRKIHALFQQTYLIGGTNKICTLPVNNGRRETGGIAAFARVRVCVCTSPLCFAASGRAWREELAAGLCNTPEEGH